MTFASNIRWKKSIELSRSRHRMLTCSIVYDVGPFSYHENEMSSDALLFGELYFSVDKSSAGSKKETILCHRTFMDLVIGPGHNL